MKKTIRALWPFLSILLIAVGCTAQNSEKQSPESEVSDSTSSVKAQALPLVTFVELGSVKCIPCKMMQPIIDEIAEEFAGQVQVVFHDVWTEDGKPYANLYDIRGIPTQIFLDKEGNEYFRHTGFFPKDEIVKILRQKGVR